MTNQEMELYSKVWIMVVKKLASNNLKYNVWKYYLNMYNVIRMNNPEMHCLLSQMASDLLSANVFDFSNDGEYEKSCMKLINDRNQYLAELNQNEAFASDRQKIILNKNY